MSSNLIRPDDSPAMAKAVRELIARRISFTRPTEYQLKISNMNFYPGKGTIHFDGVKAVQKHLTLEAALSIIVRHAS